ncbi:serine/threonine protein kinase [Blastopirellula retiformator]|uniref:Serine/threonine-protein kinase StkP n=1 Tax=Blastopirellula retiformator TaxID=2527970 RepID=A0A5C5V144_9BACT|nr:protein kinase [Blastopirellula retiformator]TWT31640.1 Serine/threonine-protein kinase StkP [Blastopirellula retiformator]
MAVANTHDFWKLLLKSNLLPKDRCQQLHESYKQQANGDADPKKLAKWLISESAITPYQARILLGGKSGPFQLGAYKLLDRIDAGLLAGAYRAVHVESGHPVLLHKISKSILDNPQAWAVVEQQIRSRCAAPHPHLWRCFELLEVGGNRFLATEEPTGNPLQESRPGPGQPVPAADCARLVRQATLAVDCLHSIGIIQGNLTPDALWLEANGNLKVMNNPLQLPSPADWNKADEATLRRADFTAPELSSPGTPPTRLSDIYSLGCILFDLLTGNPPFAGGDLQQKFSRHAGEPVAQAPQIPPPMFQTLAYMMAKSPTVRYQSAGDVASALAHHVDPSQLNPPVVTAPPTLGAYQQSLPQTSPPPSATPPQGMPQHFSPPTAAPFPGSPGMSMPGAPGMPTPGGPGMPMPGAPPTPPPMPGYGVPPTAAPMATPVATPVAAPVATPVGAPVATPVGVPASGAPVAGVQGESRAAILAERARKKKQVKRITQLVVLGLLAIGMGGAGIYVLQNMSGDGGDVADNDPSPAPTDPSNPPANPMGGGNGPSNPPANPPAGDGMPVQLVADDQQTLWASPTQGAPITLEGLPTGVKSVLTLRVDELTGSQPGQQVLAALGPQFNAVWKGWETTSRFSWSEVESAVFAYGPTTPAAQPTIVVRLKGPTNLMSKWGGAQSVGQGPAQYFKLGAWSFFPLPGASDRGFVMGADSDIAAIAASGGKAPLLPLEMEQLRRSSDDQRTLNLLFDARYLMSPQSPLGSGNLASLKEPVSWFLGDMIQAGLVSCQLDATHCYTEGRFIGSLAAEPFGLAESLRARILGGSKLVANTVTQLSPTPYWQSLGGKFPTMLEFVHKFTRTGADGKQAIVNIALPSYAAPNLLAASELTISASSGGASAAPPTAIASGGGGAQTLQQKLKNKISLGFPQTSLDFAMGFFGDELGAPVKLLGGDLQLDGITQNQQIRQFNMMDKPAEEVLVALLMKANPITTVTAPNEADQKLVYVIGPDPENPDGEKVILITTRAQAAKKKYELPAPFQLKK